VLVGDVEYAPGQASERGLKAVADYSGVTRHVPQEYPTIQNAVDAASPGDLVLVDKGVYVETVFVTTPSVTIRGVDRNEVCSTASSRSATASWSAPTPSPSRT
jgi:pectin methylesterase-like acyl-CoA thioesterase